jgi:hypothetical protein
LRGDGAVRNPDVADSQAVGEMSTTNLFVELLVIGVGAACWVGLLLLGGVRIEAIPEAWLRSYPLLLLCLAFIYVLGIVTDRLADWTFDRLFSSRIRERFFASKREYQDARRLVLSSSTRLADLHEYGRTRIRICRGWALNSMVASVVLAVQALLQPEHPLWGSGAAQSAMLAFFGLSLGCWWAWRLLCTYEYLKVGEHADFLRSAPHLKLHKAA